jgi:DNA-binding response OmpR family regulator
MSKKILIIDDDKTVVKMLEAFLTAHGYEILTAGDGEEGIQKIKSNPPDMIVLDVQMPRMNGYTFMFELKNCLSSPIPVIVLTAKEGMAEIFKVEGVKEYLVKPLQPEALLIYIKKYLP